MQLRAGGPGVIKGIGLLIGMAIMGILSTHVLRLLSGSKWSIPPLNIGLIAVVVGLPWWARERYYGPLTTGARLAFTVVGTLLSVALEAVVWRIHGAIAPWEYLQAPVVLAPLGLWFGLRPSWFGSRPPAPPGD